MLTNKIKKLFIQTAFLSAFFFLFSLAFFTKSVNACAAGVSCGACGGNACSSASPNYTGNCQNLGNSYDCSPCYSCSPAAAPAPAAPAAPSGTSCGGWCQGQVGHSSPPWCQCNRNTSDAGYTLHSCTTSGVYDCSTCCSFTQAAAPAPTAAPSSGIACGQWCQNQVGHSAPPYCRNDANPSPGYTLFGCTSSGISDNSYCCAFTQNGGSGGGGGGTSSQSCGALGGTDCTTASPRLHDGQNWYCHSLGNSSDCTPCLQCSTTRSAVCSGGGGGGGGGGPAPTATPTPAPTCTISLSPSSLKLQVGDSILLTANVSVQNGSISKVNFTSANSTIASLNPTYVSSAPYTIAVYGNSVGSTTITAQALLSPSGSCSTPTSVPVSVEAKSWFQTQGGDVYTGGSLSDKIPETATDRNLSLELDNWPGVIAHQDTNGVDLGSGFSSLNTLNNWLSLSEYQGKIYGSFQFFKKKFATQMATENYSSGNGTNAPSEDKVYYAKSSRTLSGNWSLGNNRWIVLLVEGDVSINTDIIVPKGSFLAIAATGSIVFNSSVTKAQGMFVADNRIDTSSGAIAFEGQGTFTAPQVILGRDFKDNRNQTTPVESFVARPDFIMSSYKDADNNLWYFNFLWKELAP